MEIAGVIGSKGLNFSSGLVGKNFLFLIPLVGLIATSVFTPFYCAPFFANVAGLGCGRMAFKTGSAYSPEGASRFMKLLAFIPKHLYIIYLASLITAIALMHLSLIAAVTCSFITAMLTGYAYNERNRLADMNMIEQHNQPIVY